MLFFVIISQIVSAQSRNGIDLEGIWKNQDGEILHMKCEEYVLPLSVKGTTWAIHRPFSDEVWLWQKIQ